MSGRVVLFEHGTWQIVRPIAPLTTAHLLLRAADSRLGSQDPAGVERVAGLLDAYRIARAGLRDEFGCDGFGLSFPWSWTPYGDGIGEPAPESRRIVFHVFGRSPDEQVKPVRLLAMPVHDRPAAARPAEQAELDRRLSSAFARSMEEGRAALEAGRSLLTDPGPAGCDGCSAETEREQELWRAGGVRVLRPRKPVIGANVLVMPVRHVVSPASLDPREVISYAERLREIHVEFAERFGSGGLSCFLNDGARSGQETPHVHLHVFGRAVDEPQNPFEILGRRLGLGSVKGRMGVSRSW